MCGEVKGVVLFGFVFGEDIGGESGDGRGREVEVGGRVDERFVENGWIVFFEVFIVRVCELVCVCVGVKESCIFGSRFVMV